MSYSDIRIVYDSFPADDAAQELHIWKPSSDGNLFQTPRLLSDALCEFFGLPHGSKLSRSDATRTFLKYVKDRGLIHGHKITPDKAIIDLLELKPEDDLNILNLARYLRSHIETIDHPSAFSAWLGLASHRAQSVIGIDARLFGEEDLIGLYEVLDTNPAIQFVLFKNLPESEEYAPCGCVLDSGSEDDEDEDDEDEDDEDEDAVDEPLRLCEYHQGTGSGTANCGCSENFNVTCTYHEEHPTFNNRRVIR
jgi:hypothetical protein